MRNPSERTENHTLTVRKVARHFEQSGVPRTERSIVNWCRQNRQGVARLDAFFDENEGRYYITPQSVSRAIEEERAKQPTGAKTSASLNPQMSETIPQHPENTGRRDAGDLGRLKELERQNRDLEIATRAKDYYIERLEKEQDRYVDQLVRTSRYIGELETKVLQLGGATRPDHGPPQGAEDVGNLANEDRT